MLSSSYLIQREKNIISYFQETNVFIANGLKGEGCILVHWYMPCL